MNWIREHCHVVDHPRFTASGPTGRDLWHWGMLFSGKHETDGELLLSDVLATPWGAGGKKNIVVAQKLVDVGLWERTDTGYRILRWSEMGNPTKAELEVKRKEERDGRKVRRSRSGSVPPPAPDLGSGHVSAPDDRECPPRTPQGVPYSLSDSEELTGRKTIADPERPASSGLVRRDMPLDADARAAWATGTFHGDPDKTIDVVWLAFCGEYAGRDFGSRESLIGKFQKWVTKECDMAKTARIQRRDRDAKFEQRNRPPSPFTEPEKLTPEKQRELAERFPMRRRDRGAA